MFPPKGVRAHPPCRDCPSVQTWLWLCSRLEEQWFLSKMQCKHGSAMLFCLTKSRAFLHTHTTPKRKRTHAHTYSLLQCILRVELKLAADVSIVFGRFILREQMSVPHATHHLTPRTKYLPSKRGKEGKKSLFSPTRVLRADSVRLIVCPARKFLPRQLRTR